MQCPSVLHPAKSCYFLFLDQGPFGKAWPPILRRVSFYVDGYLEIQNKILPESSIPVVPVLLRAKVASELSFGGLPLSCALEDARSVAWHLQGHPGRCNLPKDNSETTLALSSTGATGMEESGSFLAT